MCFPFFYACEREAMNLPTDLVDTVKFALNEDIGSGDVTADLIPELAYAKATVICREDAVLCGTAWFDEVFQQIDSSVVVQWQYQDGDQVKANDVLCTLSGKARSLLTGERAALNFLQSLSATATQTNSYVKLIEHTSCRILDTRKTLPMLRNAQKYAVTCGGGTNHRIGLYDRVLIKENHIMAAGSIANAVTQAKQLHPDVLVEVETENLDELSQAIAAKADIVMLDNYSLDDMRIAVQQVNGAIPLEASGGVNKETVVAIAETGVDFISVGEITKHVRAIDLSMRFQG